MTNKDRILSVMTTKEICDDCLSDQSGVRPRQTVYSICRTLSQESIIIRDQGKCNLCRKPKLVNLLLSDQPSKKEVEVSLQDVKNNEPSKRTDGSLNNRHRFLEIGLE